MRVALCHPTFWPEVRRGAERLTRELADGLLAAGHAPRIVTSHPGPTSRRIEDGVEVVRLRRPPSARLERRLFEPHLPLIPFTYRELMRSDDDVVQAMQATDAVAAARWTRATGRPSVFAHMGIPHRQALVNRRARVAVMTRAVQGCSAVTALSEHARDAFWRWLGVQARVIHPPVDTEFFSVGSEPRTEEVTIVCAADAREPRKRVALLVEALAVVRRSQPGARLLLDARTAAELAGVPGVELVAMDDRAALRELYSTAWVSALPSWGEAFGLVLAEALACGTPVVGADREGIPEVLGGDDRVGRLFRGQDPADVARAVLEAIELAADPATRAHCRARGELFSVARCAAAHVELYEELRATQGPVPA